MSADGWISLDDWCRKYEDTRATVHARVHAGRWIRGFHFAAPDGGSCYVHEARAKAWLIERGKLQE